jgi:predicted transcriptional regulator of viral defense system
MKSTHKNSIPKALIHKGVLRSRDAILYGISRMGLKRLVEKGLLIREDRGVYRIPDSSVSEQDGLVQACTRVPVGVLCLLTALQFHGMTTQFPHEVWMAIDVWARKPRIKRPPMRFVRFSGKARTVGVEEHKVKGGTVRVYGAAKTVVDCFKYRNKLGLDVAIEALKSYREEKMGTTDEIWKYSRVCRVSNVIRPYLEALA